MTKNFYFILFAILEGMGMFSFWDKVTKNGFCCSRDGDIFIIMGLVLGFFILLIWSGYSKNKVNNLPK